MSRQKVTHLFLFNLNLYKLRCAFARKRDNKAKYIHGGNHGYSTSTKGQIAYATELHPF